MQTDSWLDEDIYEFTLVVNSLNRFGTFLSTYSETFKVKIVDPNCAYDLWTIPADNTDSVLVEIPYADTLFWD